MEKQLDFQRGLRITRTVHTVVVMEDIDVHVLPNQIIRQAALLAASVRRHSHLLWALELAHVQDIFLHGRVLSPYFP